MEALFTRYRNLTVLLVVVAAQLLYLAYQVKSNNDDRLIRVWAVSAVTPMAGVVGAIRRNTIGFLEDYFILLDVREQNLRLKADNARLRLDNVYFRNQLNTAEHARALTLFQAQTPSKTIAARVIGNSTVLAAKAVFIDRGATSGIEKGMAVVTPEGIVGKVSAVYPLVSQVLLVTDPTFKVGVESQKGHVHGVLNCGSGKCTVEQIQNEDKVDPREWFYTSGEDRIFPKGFPVGAVVSVQPGQGMKDVKLNLSGAPGGVDEILILVQGAHQPIPTVPVAVVETNAKMLPLPPEDGPAEGAIAARPQTEADKILQKYDAIGKEQNHVYGGYMSNLPNFNAKEGGQPKPAEAAEKPNTGKTVTSTAPPGVATPPSILGTRPGTKPPVIEGRPTAKKPVVDAPAAKADVPAAKAPLSETPSARTPPVTRPTARPATEPPPLLGAPRHKVADPSVQPAQPSNNQ